MAMVVGWMVEWSNSFRDYLGVVIDKKETTSTVFAHYDYWIILDILTLTEHEVSTSTKSIRKVRPAVLEMANYLRNKYLSMEKDTLPNTETQVNIHNKVIQNISGRVLVSNDCDGAIDINGLAAAKLKAIAHEKKLLTKLRSKKMRTTQEASISSDLESVEDNCKADCEEENNSDEIDEDDDEEDENDNDGNDDEDDESDDDDDEDEDNETDDVEDDDDDEAKEDQKGDIDGGKDDDEDEDEHQAPLRGRAVDVKVYIKLGTPDMQQDIRGFLIKINAEGLNKIRSTIQKDYETQFRLFYRESDGDIITIRSCDDLKYAYRAELQNQSLTNKRKPPAIKLKLFAENIANPQPAQNKSASPPISVKSVCSSSLPEDTIKAEHFAETSHLLAGDSLDASLYSSASTSARTFGERHDGAFELIWKRGELLGTGSFGQVYSGINLSNGERMAVKEVVLNPGKRHKEQAKALRQEVKILSTLDHPNIIKYLGTEFKEGALRIFLELATDGTVKDALNEFGAFPEPLIRRYAADIIEGLAFLHAKLFIHRDIKPTNLLVSNGVVKLADFGCSSQYFENGTTSNAGHGTVVGTTVYMAPEVMNGECFNFSPDKSQTNEPMNETFTADMNTKRRENGIVTRGVGPRPGYGKKADIWSVGITLTEMATAQVPFANAGAAIYCVFVSKQFPRFPNHFYEDAHNFLSRCLVEQPKGRANCIELRSHPFLARQSMEVIRAQTSSASGSDFQRKSTWSTLQATLPSNISYLDTSQSRTEWGAATLSGCDEEIRTEVGAGAIESESKRSERLRRSADSSIATFGEDTGFSGLFEYDATRRRTLSRYESKGDGNENYPDDFS